MPILLFRYILGSLIPSFGIGLLIFTLVLLMDKVMRIVEWIVRKGVPATDVLKLFGCLLPSFFVLTLPTALLLAVLLTFSRMHGDNELCALRAAGVSLYRLLPPVYLFGVLVTALCLFLTGWVGPASTSAFRSMFYSVATRNLFLGLKERVFFDSLPGFVIYAEHLEPEKNRAEGIFVSDRSIFEKPLYYFAKEATIRENPEEGTIIVLMRDGEIHRCSASGDVYQIVRFARYRVKLNLGQILGTHTGRQRNVEELTLPELRQAARELPATDGKARKYLLMYHRRFALPFAALVFCSLGVPLALLSQRSVRYTGFSLSIGVVLLYFILMQAGSGLTLAGRMPALLGAWLPNLVLGSLGVYLTWRQAEEKPVRVLEAYAQLIDSVRDAVRRRLRARP